MRTPVRAMNGDQIALKEVDRYWHLTVHQATEADHKRLDATLVARRRRVRRAQYAAVAVVCARS